MVNIKIEGDKHNVKVTPTMYQRGWYGGVWVRFVGKRIVDLATPTQIAGFLLRGYKLRDQDYSDSYTFTPYQYENNPVDATYGIVTLETDSGEFEMNSKVYDSTKIYSDGDLLYVNNDSVLTNDNTLGGPSVGMVIATPQENNSWLGFLMNVNFK